MAVGAVQRPSAYVTRREGDILSTSVLFTRLRTYSPGSDHDTVMTVFDMADVVKVT